MSHILLRSSLHIIAVGVIVSAAAFSQQLPKQKHSHEVPIDSAKKFIKNLENDAVQLKTKGGMFYREVFDKILAQKGCIGLRYYYAKTSDGTPTLVIVGVDSTGNDMTKSTVGEMTFPCPPYCATATDLTK